MLMMGVRSRGRPIVGHGLQETAGKVRKDAVLGRMNSPQLAAMIRAADIVVMRHPHPEAWIEGSDLRHRSSALAADCLRPGWTESRTQ